MAWNEPGGSKDNDPWSGGSKSGPPDLDESLRKFQEKLARFFGGGRAGSGRDAPKGKGGSFGISAVILVVLAVWGLSGFYTVNEGSRGVVLGFGKYVDTVGSGLHWHIPFPIEQVEVVNIEQIRNVEIGYRSTEGGQGGASIPREALMLTQDENIIDINFAVQYKIKDAKDYLFNVKDPDDTLRQVTESAVREAIGKSTMDFVLTEGRSQIVMTIETMIQQTLDHYRAGLEVTSVNMQDAQPPEQVQGSFSDAVKAREDEVRLKNEAEAYSNDIIPRARGQAARMIEESNAYKEKVIAQAEGEAGRFRSILAEYKKAPKVTRERLYLDAMERVMNNSSKVMVDIKKGNNMLYLPLDRLNQREGAVSAPDSSVTTTPSLQQAPQLAPESAPQASTRSSVRQREVR
ncbi:MAG: FtsH protease activity modulator HflK [Gammaproteobacteria bacterium]|nr:FtsH protease activity modulator HflK [Gammaproteobacteria bacterium]